MKKSDNLNGYHIVSDVFGTCFLRISETRTHIDTQVFRSKTNRCSYSKIPHFLAKRVFHLYIEIPQEHRFYIYIPEGARLINFHEPCRKNGKLVYTALVYSPSGEIPQIQEYESEFMPAGIFIKITDIDDIIDYTLDMLCPLPVRHYYIDEHGNVTGGRKPDIEPKFTGFHGERLCTKFLNEAERFFLTSERI